MLSAPAALLRRQDPDRFLTALFAPAAHREALMTLYAFNIELARARSATNEPTLALIRLQWWREVVQGAARRHEVASPLRALIDAGRLNAGELLALIEARETEAAGDIADLAAWRGFLLASAGGLAVTAGRLLGAPETACATLRRLGAAYGIAGSLRNVPALARQGRCLLPQAELAAAGLTPEAVIAAPEGPALRPLLHQLAAEGRGLLEPLPAPAALGGALAAALPAVLARRDLARIARDRPTPPARGLADRMAVVLAGLRGRL